MNEEMITYAQKKRFSSVINQKLPSFVLQNNEVKDVIYEEEHEEAKAHSDHSADKEKD